ncbi:TIGR02281 family clan AA aspartic protease [Devosia sp. ZB163]|uniref:retropepsin-like aspartic protease family protein n=1 Tax=Devosia sp. ZB163 TaxID=3025938 RepID=UPI002361F4F5|nr:TIGR02281 family clan AA aspartic protease [Devosia sp. ZB163]MDC9823882.1 TIGR02281 family clan AA aspartic protease [Devosia sp. ZB163]
MLFIGFAILIAIGLALLVSADAGTLVGLTQDQMGQLIPLVAILIVIAGGLFARRHRFSELIGNLVLWAGIFGVALVGYTYREDLTLVASRVFGELVPGVATVDRERGTATFRGGRDGHFMINAAINGSDIRTIFDTGASAVVLSQSDAERIGLATDALDYSVPVSTANGTGRAATVTLDRVEVGGIVRNNVRAFVAERDALETSLLGMSFLGTLSRYAVSGNSLELVD